MAHKCVMTLPKKQTKKKTRLHHAKKKKERESPKQDQHRDRPTKPETPHHTVRNKKTVISSY